MKEMKETQKTVETTAVVSETKEAEANKDDMTLEDFLEMDRRDEAQITAFLEGRIIGEYFYRFKQQGRQVEGITVSGVRELANRLGDIHASEPKWEESESAIRAWCSCVNYKTNVVLWGAAIQSKFIELKELDEDTGERKKIPDPYAFTKAFQKAQRNAIRQHLPEPVVKAWAAAYFAKRDLQLGKGKPTASGLSVKDNAILQDAKHKTIEKLYSHGPGYDEELLELWSQTTLKKSFGDFTIEDWRIAWVFVKDKHQVTEFMDTHQKVKSLPLDEPSAEAETAETAELENTRDDKNGEEKEENNETSVAF